MSATGKNTTWAGCQHEDEWDQRNPRVGARSGQRNRRHQVNHCHSHDTFPYLLYISYLVYVFPIYYTYHTLWDHLRYNHDKLMWRGNFVLGE